MPATLDHRTPVCSSPNTMPPKQQRARLPPLDHISYEEYEQVYEPSEDSFLMCDALLADADAICGRRPGLVVEIGPGSGVVTTYLCTLLRDRGLPVPCCLGIDINQKACEVTRRTAAAANLDEHEQEHDAEVKATRQPADAAAGQRSVTNASKGSCAKGMLPSCIGKRVDTLCSDLLSNLLMTAATPSSSTAASSSSSSDHRSPQLSASAPASSSATPQVGTATDVQPNRCAGLIDILLFNPPYVPTPDEEVYAPAGLVTEGGRTPGTSTATATAGAGADRASQSQPTADPLVAAWAGGERGRRVIDRALPQIAAALSRPSPAGASSTGAESSDTPEAINSGCGGVVYMVLVDDNEPADVAAMSRKLGLASKIIARTQARNESLMIMRLQWADGAT